MQLVFIRLYLCYGNLYGHDPYVYSPVIGHLYDITTEKRIVLSMHQSRSAENCSETVVSHRVNEERQKLQGRSQDFSKKEGRGGGEVTVFQSEGTHQIVMSFSQTVVGCLLAPQDPLAAPLSLSETNLDMALTNVTFYVLICGNFVHDLLEGGFHGTEHVYHLRRRSLQQGIFFVSANKYLALRLATHRSFGL